MTSITANNNINMWDNVAPYEYIESTVPSSTEQNVWHTVTQNSSDPTDKSCSCKGWKYRNKCKHSDNLHTNTGTKRYVWRNHTFTEDEWNSFIMAGWNDNWGDFPTVFGMKHTDIESQISTPAVMTSTVHAPVTNGWNSTWDEDWTPEWPVEPTRVSATHDQQSDWIGKKCWLSTTISGLDEFADQDDWVIGTITSKFEKTSMHIVTLVNKSTIVCHINSLINLHKFEWDDDWVWEDEDDCDEDCDEDDCDEDCDEDDCDEDCDEDDCEEDDCDEDDCDEDDCDEDDCDEDDCEEDDCDEDDCDEDDCDEAVDRFFDKDFCAATGTRPASWFNRTPVSFTKYDLIWLLTCKNTDGKSLLEKSIEKCGHTSMQNTGEMLNFLTASIDK